MIFLREDASLNLNVSASTTKSMTLVRFTDRAERNGMSNIPECQRDILSGLLNCVFFC